MHDQSKPASNAFVKLLLNRKLIKQTTSYNLPDKICMYCGFDPTSASLHIGSLIPLQILRIAKRLGYTTICIVGSGTAMIGDPTWKNQTRKMLDQLTINNNMINIQKQLQDIAAPDFILCNHEWLTEVNILAFLRDTAAYFSVNQLLSLETFRTRIDNKDNLSFMEFTYPLLQAYDFLYLWQKYQCNLQLGGSDQWGNITQGLQLIKKVTGAELHGLTSTLLLNSSGEKMGKTVSGSVFLDSDLVSPYDFWQFWRNVDDSMVHEYLLQLTDLDENYISDIINDITNAKKILADEITTLVHGTNESREAREKSEELFEINSFDSLPEIRTEFGATLDKIIVLLKITDSIGEAKRQINSGSVKINGVKVIQHKHIMEQGVHIVCFGKKKYFKINIG